MVDIVAVMELELRHLRALCAIADAGSVTRAAAVLGVSQPALAAQLQRVERELGGHVFTRDRHGVTATALGEYVLTRARGVLLSMEELRRDVASQVPLARSVVRIGGIASPLSVRLTDRLTDYLPDAEVRLQSEYSPRVLLDLVLAGRLDAAAIVDYPGFALRASDALLVGVIAEEPVFVVLSDRHDLAGRTELDLAELADEPWVLTPSDGAGWPEYFHGACRQAGFTPNVPYTVSDTVLLRELVMTRRAISPCQAGFACGAGVVVKPLAGDPVGIRHLVVCRRDGRFGPMFDELVRLAQEIFRASAARQPEHLAWRRRRERGGQAA
jgi:DNA-binding transcriptional LysR family regulator